ncbi:MAG TPA: protocatechuate 3,4-dioxygenase subunit alpha [Acidimicrobiales bacterium]|nr:protocatechuate 3,4-dioxygenase subunit alpha [Acidimicrobiales bacterium]
MSSPATPSQTAGPFVSIGTTWLAGANLADVPGPAAVEVTGTVTDGAGAPVTDAMLEFWQADSEGHFPPETADGWTGFARLFTDTEGRYRLVTVKPGPPRASLGAQVAAEAPHIAVSIFARGLLQRLVTRVYFPGEPANVADPALSALSPELQERLVAQAGATGASGRQVYHFDVHLQGERETVFFAPW